MFWCARTLTGEWGRTKNGERAVRVRNTQYCHVRYCPNCQAARSRKKIREFLDVLPVLEEERPDYTWLFLTITVKNVPTDMVRETFTDVLNAGMSRLTRRKCWPGVGWITAREVTRSKTRGDAHPHLHVLLLVRPSYFQTGYLTHSQWIELVRETFRLDYDPSIRIRRVGNGRGELQLRKALLETFKYAVKAQDMIVDRDWCLQLTDQMHKLRAHSNGGLLRKLLVERDDDEEDGIDPELDDFEALWFVPDADVEPFLLRWKPSIQDYVISEVPLMYEVLPWGYFMRN